MKVFAEKPCARRRNVKFRINQWPGLRHGGDPPHNMYIQRSSPFSRATNNLVERRSHAATSNSVKWKEIRRETST